jgi:hypothetical protein
MIWSILMSKMERLYVMVYGKEGSNINFVKQIDANTFLCVLMKEEEDETLVAELGRQL